MLRVVLLACAVMLAACQPDTGATNRAAMQAWVGKSLADLQVRTLDNEKQPLKDILLDKKPVVLNVWATWCPPCLKEMPTLDALGKEGKYDVVAIATDKDAGSVKDFLKKQAWGSGLQVWFDSLGEITRDKMGAVGIPVTYVLDTSLTIVMVEAGERNWVHPAMEAKIAKALAK